MPAGMVSSLESISAVCSLSTFDVTWPDNLTARNAQSPQLLRVAHETSLQMPDLFKYLPFQASKLDAGSSSLLDNLIAWTWCHQVRPLLSATVWRETWFLYISEILLVVQTSVFCILLSTGHSTRGIRTEKIPDNDICPDSHCPHILQSSLPSFDSAASKLVPEMRTWNVAQFWTW